MSTFEFVAVLFSVILGLSLTQVLQGYRALMLARRRTVVYWPALIWSGLIIVATVQVWWGMFAMRQFTQWTFEMYAIVLLQITVLYLVAGLTVPEVPENGTVDMREHYFANSHWFFGLLALAIVVSVAKDIVTTGHVSRGGNEYYLATMFGLSVVAALVKWRWFHAVLAPLCISIVLAYALLTPSHI